MIIQACLNGARDKDHHAALPLTLEAMVSDAVACLDAGANEFHIHPRDPHGREALAETDALVQAVRKACPGSLIGVSTGAWIEDDVARTRNSISEWSCLPDYASVNLSEEDAPAICALLEMKGVGIEAGLATVDDARRFVTLAERHRVFRVLFEIEDQNLDRAERTLMGIQEVLDSAGVERSILLHGFDETVWHFIRRAREYRWSTRVGLEDGRTMLDGSPTKSNADMVLGAVQLFR